MHQFTAQAFTPHLGQTFRFRPFSEHATETAELELIAVEAGLCDQLTPGQRQPFSLLFELRGQAALRRGLQRLQHPDLDACDLFLARVHVPEGQPGAAYREAVFG
jgi:hypothetical protein